MAIPTRILEEINNNELNAKDFYSTYGKENVDNAVAALKQSDKEILSAYSVEDMRTAVTAKLMRNANKGNEKGGRTGSRPSSTWNFQAHKILGYAAAAVLLAAIIVPVSIKNSAFSAGKAPVIREKGPSTSLQSKNPELRLYRQKAREVQALNNGDFAHSGDIIQIAYNAGSAEYGVIFSVDGNGNITRHFPENSWQAAQLIHRKDDTPLDFSYELDNAPDFECFIMVTSKKQFNLTGIEKQIKNKTDIKYLTELSYLPKKTDGITFILEK